MEGVIDGLCGVLVCVQFVMLVVVEDKALSRAVESLRDGPRGEHKNALAVENQRG